MQSFYFDINFIGAATLFLLSLLFYFRDHSKLSIWTMMIGSIFLGVFLALKDNFLYTWDEQYHALVASNLCQDPLKPTLIKNDVLDSTSTLWNNSEIWLHKQPLFLWQMAISIKLFGATEFAVRFPSILMHAFLIFPIYRVGKLCFNSSIGYTGAFLYSVGFFPLNYLTGYYPTDHNDTAFSFYFFLSFWALFEYLDTPKASIAVFVGLFAGMAILCKWLVGLLVFGSWIITIIYSSKGDRSTTRQEIRNLFLALIVCIFVFLPWQIFCYLNYPLEFSIAMKFNQRHITEALEGHNGNFTFYYKAFYEYFGEGSIIPPLVISSFILALLDLKKVTNRIIWIIAVGLIFLFFSFVKTKMIGYGLPTLPFFFISIGYIVIKLSQKINILTTSPVKIKTFYFLVLIITAALLFNSDKLYKFHSNKEKGRSKSRNIKQKERKLYTNLDITGDLEDYVIFNCNTSLNSHISATFYSGITAYGFIPTEEHIEKLHSLNKRILIIDSSDIPDFIRQDKSIQFIKF